jgi:hypothetical protein
MSSTTPGLPGQNTTRTTLRVVGGVLLVAALGLFGFGLADFLSAMSPDPTDGPHHFWMLFVGLLLFAPAGWCLQAGFTGTAARYVAGETLPVVRDAASYLSGCRACGTRHDAGAAFCDHCGAALAG